MNFDLTDEQRLLQDSVARFVADNYSLEKRIALTAAEPGFSTEHWRTFAELGWLALPFSEADGGIGGNALDVMLLMEQFGKALVVEPFLASIVLGGGAFARAGNAAQKAKILPGVIDGSLQLALAYAETQARHEANDVITTARRDGGSFVLNGKKTLVLNGATANLIVVSARTGGAQSETQGISLFLLDPKAEGVKLENYPTVDGLRASEVTLTNVRIDESNLLGDLHGGFAVLAATLGDGILAVGAEAIGAMEVLVKDTVTYTQQRQQFGHALAQFQVLQHRMVDMLVEQELCKSLLYRATMESVQGLPNSAKTVHALKHMVGTAGTFVGENAVQLHGGMGMTEELRVGHYFKRLMVINLLFGDADYHLERFVG